MLDAIREILGLSESDLADLFRVRAPSVYGWRAAGIPDARRASVERILDLATVLRREIKATRIPQIVRTPDDWLGGKTILETIPAPSHDPGHPLQALVTNLDASPYVGRLALLRVRHGSLRKGAPIAWCRADGTIQQARVTELYVTEALDRVPTDEAGPGDIIAIAGIEEITIGETIADPDDPRDLYAMLQRAAA